MNFFVYPEKYLSKFLCFHNLLDLEPKMKDQNIDLKFLVECPNLDDYAFKGNWGIADFNKLKKAITWYKKRHIYYSRILKGDRINEIILKNIPNLSYSRNEFVNKLNKG